jgi:hypothetical protein
VVQTCSWGSSCAGAISLKAQVQTVQELLTGATTAGQKAEAYRIHPDTAGAWEHGLLEKTSYSPNMSGRRRKLLEKPAYRMVY